MTLLFRFLLMNFCKTYNFVTDISVHICMWIQAISKFRLNWKKNTQS